MKQIIGLTGSFGSGCSFIAKEKIRNYGYEYISLSDILREEYKKEFNTKPNDHRNVLQDYGNKIREKNGNNYLAKLALDKINNETNKKWIIDSIRNPGEIQYLKKEIAEFYLIGVFADIETRWQRVKKDEDDDQRIFHKNDKRDANESIKHGQKVSECFKLSDIIIINNDMIHEGNQADTFLTKKIEKYIKIIEKKKKFEPNEMETIMSIAYANSMRSNCLKRKVGSVIIDDYGNLFSSGYNEVPKDDQTCKQAYGKCYRDYLREEIAGDINKIISDIKNQRLLSKLLKNKFKNLDYCKSLHAEENAILNIARSGGSSALFNSSIYTTTYPCNLCANKIVQVGIKKVVYLEPYPMLEAKKILEKNNISLEPFEGVLFNGYFRFKGE